MDSTIIPNISSITESSTRQPWSRTQVKGLLLAFDKKRDIFPLPEGRLDTAADGGLFGVCRFGVFLSNGLYFISEIRAKMGLVPVNTVVGREQGWRSEKSGDGLK